MGRNYNYCEIIDKINDFLSAHPAEYFYPRDIQKEIPEYTVYAISKALKSINSSQIMHYTDGSLVYVSRGYSEEKQIPEQFVEHFLTMGWKSGRCEASKRAICVAEGGDPDRDPLVWIHREQENKEVPESELTIWIERGWVRGKLNQPTLGKVAIHRGFVDKYIFPEELPTYLSEGWSEGGKSKRSLRDYTNPWNKGKTKETEPGLMTLSEKARQHNLNMPQEERDKIAVSVSNLWKNPEYRSNQCSKMRGRIPHNKGKRYKLTPEAKQNWLEKSTATKRARGSFNTSKPEEEFYQFLIKYFDPEDIERQYYDKLRYPFRCDFYISSRDLFIECNFHWTHNTHPFDSTNTSDVEEAEKLLELSNTSDFYKVAYSVWTDLDVRKQKTAKRNKLNYQAIYGGKEEEWKIILELMQPN